MAGAFSDHLINSYTTIPHQRSAFAPFGQDVKPQQLSIHGPMSFLPTMHGSFSEQPSFADQSSMFMEISQATTQKIAKLQATLDKKLGPEYISQRPGPGGTQKLTYAEGWKIINLANEIFGFNGWSSTVVNLTVDFIDCNEESKRYTVGVTAIVRVTLRDGVFHEDIGYGMLENSKSKGQALDKCKKEAVTDGVKRALRSFGNVLGNCLYDKEYAREIIKIKVPPAKFDKEDLYRRPEYSITPSRISNATASSSKPTAAPSRPMPPQITTPGAAPVRPYREMPPPNVSVTSTSKVQEPVKLTSAPRTNAVLPPPQPVVKQSSTEEIDELLPEGASFEYTPSDDDTLMLAAELDLASGIGGPIYFENTTADMEDTSAMSKADRSSILAGMDADPLPAQAPAKAAQNGHGTNDGKRDRSHAIAAALASVEATPSPPPPPKPQPVLPASILKQPHVDRTSATSSSSASARAQQSSSTSHEHKQPPGKADTPASAHTRAPAVSPSSMGGGFNLPPGFAPPSARRPVSASHSGIGVKRPADAMQFATAGSARRPVQGMGLDHRHHVGESSSSSGDPKRPRL